MDLGRVPPDRLGQDSRTANDMFAAVEDEEEPTRPQLGDDASDGVCFQSGQLQGCGDRAGDIGVASFDRKVDERHVACELGRESMGGRDGDRCLADAAWTDEGDQPLRGDR